MLGAWNYSVSRARSLYQMGKEGVRLGKAQVEPNLGAIVPLSVESKIDFFWP